MSREISSKGYVVHNEKGCAIYAKEACELEPTTIMSKAIERIEKLGDYKVMVALVNETNDTDIKIEDRLHIFTDIRSAKLRSAIYKCIEENA